MFLCNKIEGQGIVVNLYYIINILSHSIFYDM